MHAPVLALAAIIALAQPRQPVTPPPARPPEPGFTALVPAPDLGAWTAIPTPSHPTQPQADAALADSWTIRDGELAFVGTGPGLATRQAYGDLDLRLDWRIDLGASARLGLRGTPGITLRDIAQGSGSIAADNDAGEIDLPLVRADNPASLWNSLRIIDLQGRLTVYINDVPVTIDQPLTAANRPGTLGPITLRARGPLNIRNLRLRTLDNTRAPAPIALAPGARLAILGGRWLARSTLPRLLETTLRATAPQLDTRVLTLASSDVLTTPPSLEWWAPTIALVIPDAPPITDPITDSTADSTTDPAATADLDAFAQRWTALATSLASSGVQPLMATPPFIDPALPGTLDPALLRDAAREQARLNAVRFVPLHDALRAGARQATQFFGQQFELHAPGPTPRHAADLIALVPVLESLGVQGDLGTITIDLAAGSASVSEGHRVVAFDPAARTITLDSTRLPMPIWGDERSPDGFRAITRATNFNNRFNRLTLRVDGAWPQTRITWGVSSRTVSAAMLKQGVNLTTLFSRFPTDERWFEIEAAVHRSHAAQRDLLARVNPTPTAAPAADPAALNVAWSQIDAASRSPVDPVRHSITLEQALDR